MLLAPKFNKVDLPIFDEDVFVAERYSLPVIEKCIDEDATKIVRAACIWTPPDCTMSLDKVLKTTDEQLDILAERCGAFVIEHEWGLYRPPEEERRRFSYYRPSRRVHALNIPQGHILVAEVNRLRNTRSLATSPDDKYRIDAAGQAYDADTSVGNWKLGDVFGYMGNMAISPSRQFKIGEDSAALISPGEQIHLVDIEPRIVRTS